jgi:hypothetical protein
MKVIATQTLKAHNCTEQLKTFFFSRMRNGMILISVWLYFLANKVM